MGVLYALLARVLLPRTFHLAYGTELEADVRERLASTRGIGRRSVIFLHEIGDLIRTAAREHWAELRDRSTEARLGAPYGNDRKAADGIDTLLQDLRHGLRLMQRAPAFSLVVILTLGLGIGLNTAVFSVVHALLLRPLTGVADQGRLVQLYRTWAGIEHGANSIPHYRDLVERGAEVFDGVAAWSTVQISVSTGDGSEVVSAQMVSVNFFDVLGAKAAIGRTFVPAEGGGVGGHPVVVISDDLWRSRFGGDPTVIGRTLRINETSFEIIGVTPQGFRGASPLRAPLLWGPLSMQPVLQPGRADRLENRNSNFMSVIARMKRDATLESTRSAVLAVFNGLRDDYPDVYERSGIRVIPLAEGDLRAAYGKAPERYATLLMGVVALLLLLACANVANLFLARSERRRREIAIRMGVGASRTRLVRQLLTESGLFAAAAAALGLAFAFLAIGLLERILSPQVIPFQVDLALSRPVLLFTLVTASGTALLFGLAPAVHGTRLRSTESLGRSASPARTPRTTPALVVVQTALAVVLLLTAALFLRSLVTSTRVDVGFDAPRLLSARLHPELAGRDRDATEAFMQTLTERLRAQAGVLGVAVADVLPLDGSSQATRVVVPGYVPAPGEQMSLDYARVGPGYFETMGIPLLRGRAIDAADDSGAVPVVVLNEAMAVRFWPGQDPIGRTIETQGRERVVVGVVENGKYGSLGEPVTPFMYLALAQDYRSATHIVLRTVDDALAFAPVLRRHLREIDPAVPIRDVRTLEHHLDASLLPSRIATAALTLFGGLGLLLSTLGLYGVIAQSVSRQTREIGIRIALGAPPARVLGAVLVHGGWLTLTGVAAGVVVSLAAARVARGILPVTPLHPAAFAAVPALLACFALVATWFPARRAAGIDPVHAVRTD